MMISEQKLNKEQLIRLRIMFLLIVGICTNDTPAFCQIAQPVSANGLQQGRLITETLTSDVLQSNLVGIDSKRNIKINLPPSYAVSKKLYPVVYYLHDNSTNPEQMFADGNLIKLLENGIAEGIVKEFIFVVPSYTTPNGGCLYENSSVNGRWLDYTVNEVVPFIESRFRVIRDRDSRGIVGDFM